MTRRLIVASLTAAILFAAGLVHSAFACTAAVHDARSRQPEHHHCTQPATPACCQAAPATAAIHKVERSSDDVRPAAAAPPLAAPAATVSAVGASEASRIFRAVPVARSSPRSYLLLRALLL